MGFWGSTGKNGKNVLEFFTPFRYTEAGKGGKAMTGEEVNALLQATAHTLRELKIPLAREISPQVLINTRAKRRLGCCYFQSGQYTIEVSASLLEDPARLRQTLAHELLHTCRGCRNHGKQWKAYAAVVNEACGMEISRLTPPKEEEPQQCLRNDEIKYLVQCQSCGALFPRARMCKLVKTPWRYRCQCGGKLKRML